MHINTKYLVAFLNVIDEGTVAAAADKMHLSQPAVTRLIQLLEQQVNVKLFYRDQRKLIPTPEAEVFYPEAHRIVSSIDEFPAFFREVRDSSLIPLRLICQLRTAPGFVTPALSAFAKRMPEKRAPPSTFFRATSSAGKFRNHATTSASSSCR